MRALSSTRLSAESESTILLTVQPLRDYDDKVATLKRARALTDKSRGSLDFEASTHIPADPMPKIAWLFRMPGIPRDVKTTYRCTEKQMATDRVRFDIKTGKVEDHREWRGPVVPWWKVQVAMSMVTCVCEP